MPMDSLITESSLIARSLDSLKRLWRRRDLQTLFVVALLLRLLLCYESAHQIGLDSTAAATPDAKTYVVMAGSLFDDSLSRESGFLTFGPGYAAFLGVWLALFDASMLMAVLINIVLSCLTCLLLYKLAMVLTNSYATAIVAGWLAALSYTSVSLSCVLLSDTLYLTLSTVGLILFLQGLKTGAWWRHAAGGILVGAAALTRAIGQFWPIAMIAITVVCLLTRPQLGHSHIAGRRLSGLAGATVAIGLAVLLIVSWTIRNWVQHDIPAFSISSAAGAAKVAALTVVRSDESPYRDVIKEWNLQAQAEKGRSNLSYREQHDVYVERCRETLEDDPLGFAAAYLANSWKNLTEICFYHRLLLPEFNPRLIPLEYRLRGAYANYLPVALALVGLTLLVIRRSYRLAIILAVIYVYYAGLIGFAVDQGSRVFLPGQMAWTILLAVVLVTTFRGLTLLAKAISHRRW